ncbi:hypothetical protein PoB_005195000 [Plakobranchus ocellatus]|uniref:Uncharacterized protein n=1 Tax=Plakobranchus ocellatus TaxID=259542 RepID=A0AAV4C1F7_9GAST|nr:hypothetical protein PoB_005195000 [Plakobranchus ocellatus]
MNANVCPYKVPDDDDDEDQVIGFIKINTSRTRTQTIAEVLRKLDIPLVVTLDRAQCRPQWKLLGFQNGLLETGLKQ